MSLLDDVSIVVTPNGYKAGELYAVVPVPTEGAEEITNGDFSSSTGWSFTNSGGSYGWIIDAGRAICDASATTPNRNLNSTFSLVNGKSYRLIIDILQSADNMKIVVGGTTLSETLPTGTNLNYEYFIPEAVHSGGGFTIYGGSSDLQEIDNVSVKEYTSADMDVTRSTAATRVDEDGLVNYAEIVGSEEITDGNFPSGTTDWSVGTGVTLSVGKAELLNTPTYSFSLEQVTGLTVGLTYLVSYEIDDYVSGQLRSRLGSNLGATISNDGVYEERIVAQSNSLIFQTVGVSFTGSIKNVSVKQEDRDNVPRIDYTGGGCPHILAEPQRTNNIQYSEDFTQSYWRKDKVTVTANSIISPSGQLNASLIQETVYTGGIPSFDLLSSITLSAGTYTYTFYVKNNNGRYLGISFGSNAQRVRTNFDFTTNTFKTLIYNGTTTGSASFTTLGDYYRISITATFPSSTATDTVIMPLATDTYPFYAFQNSDNRSFYLWGAQIEQGSYATSYIPTSGSTVTRNQDIFSRDGIGSLINSTEGVLFVEMAVLSADTINRYISLSNGTDDNSISFHFRNNANNQVRVILKSGNSNQFDATYNPSGSTAFVKVAFKYKVNDFALWVNGTEIATDTNGITFSADTLNRLAFDDGNGNSNLYGKVKQLQVYKTALTDTQLAALTS